MKRQIETAITAIEQLDAMFASSECPAPDDLEEEDLAWLCSMLKILVKRRIQVVFGLEWLTRLAPQAAVELTIGHFLGPHTSPDTKFGGYENELGIILDDMVEIRGRVFLADIVRRSDFDRSKLDDERVVRAFGEALELPEDAVRAWAHDLWRE
jgi:hypothetical protein